MQSLKRFQFEANPLTEAAAKSEMEAWYLSRRSPQKSILEWVQVFLEKKNVSQRLQIMLA